MNLIAGRLALSDVMASLSVRRRVFHSEADFQFEFAQTVADMDSDIRIRLEVPVRRDDIKRSEYVDLTCESDGMRSFIEFKYVTRSWEGADPTTGERFALRSHSAMDLARFHFVHDVYRLENWTKDRADVNGLAILLTNDPSLWKQAARAGTRDAAYRLDQDRIIGGNLVWGTPEHPFPANDRRLTGTYTANWCDYADQPLDGVGGRLRWLGWTINA